MYSDPRAIKMYADKMKLDESLIAQSIKEFHPKDAMQTDAMQDLDGIIRDAIKLKFLDRQLTKEQLAELIQIPPRCRGIFRDFKAPFRLGSAPRWAERSALPLVRSPRRR